MVPYPRFTQSLTKSGGHRDGQQVARHSEQTEMAFFPHNPFGTVFPRQRHGSRSMAQPYVLVHQPALKQSQYNGHTLVDSVMLNCFNALASAVGTVVNYLSIIYVSALFSVVSSI
jgi:hypothetical protein